MTKSEAGRLGARARYARGRGIASPARVAYEANPKKCTGCDAVIPYAKRYNSFCGHGCAAKATNTNNGHARRLVDGRLLLCRTCDSPLSGMQRWYCSPACEREYRYAKYIEKWLNGQIRGYRLSDGRISMFIRRYLLKLRGEKCEKCGWCERHPVTGKVPIQIDHVDGRWQNTTPENLQILCPNCHSLTPTYQSLNKGNGHPWRRETYRPRDRSADRNGNDSVS